jgi:hypothetical protein
VSPLPALTPDASNLAMLMLGFAGFGLATFSVGMKVGQIVEAAWWKGKLQKALTSTREPPSRQMSLVRERRERGESPLRPDSLLLRPSPSGLQAGPLGSQHILRGACEGGLGAQKQKNGPREQGSARGLG